MGEDADLFMAAAYLGDTEILDALLVEREKRTSSGAKRFFFPLVLTVQDLWDSFLGKSSTRYEKFFEELNVEEQ